MMMMLTDAQCDDLLPADLRAFPLEARQPLWAVLREGGSFPSMSQITLKHDQERREGEQKQERKRQSSVRAQDIEHEQQQRERRRVSDEVINAHVYHAQAAERLVTKEAIDAAVEHLEDRVLPIIMARLKAEWRSEHLREINAALADAQCTALEQVAVVRKEVAALRDRLREDVAALKNQIAREIAEPAGRMRGEFTARTDFVVQRLERMERAINEASEAEDAALAQLRDDVHTLQAVWSVEDNGPWRARVKESFAQWSAPVTNLHARR